MRRGASTYTKVIPRLVIFEEELGDLAVHVGIGAYVVGAQQLLANVDGVVSRVEVERSNHLIDRIGT